MLLTLLTQLTLSSQVSMFSKWRERESSTTVQHNAQRQPKWKQAGCLAAANTTCRSEQQQQQQKPSNNNNSKTTRCKLQNDTTTKASSSHPQRTRFFCTTVKLCRRQLCWSYTSSHFSAVQKPSLSVVWHRRRRRCRRRSRPPNQWWWRLVKKSRQQQQFAQAKTQRWNVLQSLSCKSVP